jgi:hypothetical protein
MSAICAFCDKKTTYGGIPKHLFSSAHMPLWKECILRSSKTFKEWITEYDAGKKSIDHKLPSFTVKHGSTERFRICFGCKKVIKSTKEHRCDCEENFKKCVEVYKNILNEQQETIVEDPITNKDQDAEIKKLQKKVKFLEDIIDGNEKIVEKGEMYRDYIKFLLEEISYANMSIHNEIIEKSEEQFIELKGDVWGLV